MKKIVSTFVLLLALCLVLVRIQFVRLVSANWLTPSTPPKILVHSPKGIVYNSNSIPLSLAVLVSDQTWSVNMSISWIGYSLDKEEVVSIPVVYEGDGRYTGNSILSGLSDGDHILEVYAKDNLATDFFGHWEGSTEVYFSVDTVFPSISIMSLENKTYYTTDIPLKVAVNEPVSWIGYSLDGLTPGSIHTRSLITTLSGLSEGIHSIIVYARDEAGNTNSSNIVYFTVDTSPPNISILSLENETYTKTDIPLNFTVDKTTSWIGYSLDGQANVTITRNTTLTGLSHGSHNLIVYAKDTAGNTGTSETIYFTTAQPSGFLGSTLPIEYGYVLAAETVAVTVVAGYFFLKRKKLDEAK